MFIKLLMSEQCIIEALTHRLEKWFKQIYHFVICVQLFAFVIKENARWQLTEAVSAAAQIKHVLRVLGRQKAYFKIITKRTRGGGGHSGTQGGRTRVTYFAEEGVSFKTSACPRFCKRRVLFCTQVRSMGGGGGENPLAIHKIYAALASSDSLMHQSIESPGGGGREMAGRCRAYPV